MLCNDVMTVNVVTLCMKTPHTHTHRYTSCDFSLIIPTLCPRRIVSFFIWCYSNVTVRLTYVCPCNRQHTGLGCRRSSSDAAYELAETVRAQRECRLRPHYSDPMPADASKRKQLEMKIAAAARLHSHRRDRDRDSGEYMTRM